MTTYTKLDANKNALPADATGHNAVRVEHPLLLAPLIVTAHHAPERMPQAQAKKWAESLDTNGWSWRLPTADEGFFIPDRLKYPALDKTYFPDLEEYEWIWTSTPDAESPSDYAWIVGLHGGGVDRDGQSFHGFVRAVLAGQ